MSGGLDSSVAALLLQRQGFDVVGITLKTWAYEDRSSAKETACCSLDSLNDARDVAVSLGFPHYVLDIREEFSATVVDDFIRQYLLGRTPNPCILCNTHIKWAALLKRADTLNISHIATGHYAKIRAHGTRHLLCSGTDPIKDQSYVLWALNQKQLSRTIFPLGDFTKQQVRQIAHEAGFEDIACKRESYEICFIPNSDYRNFLKQQLPQELEKLQHGLLLNSHGDKIGQHQGFPFYTIGQKKGIATAEKDDLYVKEILAEENTLILGKKEEIFQKEFYISGFNPIKYDIFEQGLRCMVKVRAKDAPVPARLYHTENKLVKVEMEHPLFAVAPGQSAVAYENDEVVGGGFVEINS